MFGVVQLYKFVKSEEGQVPFRVEEFQRFLKVKRSSAMRYLYEATRLGLARLNDGWVYVDINRLELVYKILKGDIDLDVVNKVLDIATKKGIIYLKRNTTFRDGDETIRRAVYLLQENGDDSVTEKLKHILNANKDKAVLLLITEPHIVMDIYYVLHNTFRNYGIKFYDLNVKRKAIVIEEKTPIHSYVAEEKA